MAGALSGHILEQYYSLKLQSTGPFGIPMNPTFNNSNMTSWPATGNIVSSGAMSFNPTMHGSCQQPMNFYPDCPEDDPILMDLSRGTAAKIAALQAKLNQQLGPEYISTRPGPGGGAKLVYVEGWKIINLANEVFGFNGWSSNLVSLTTDFVDYNEETRRYCVGVTAIVRVTLRDGVYHEDIGYGALENSKTKGPALDKCKKEAVTDGLKRALRNFGNLLGNCLYDKAYTNEIVKVKVNPPKFDKNQLHRRPEFAEPKPQVSSTSPAPNPNNASVANATSNPHTNATTLVIKSEPQQNTINQPPKPLSSVPPHVRNNVNGAPSKPSSPLATSTPAGKGNVPSNRGMTTPSAGFAARTAAILNGLSTPVTPAHQAPPQPPQQQGPGPGNGAAPRKVSFTESPIVARAPPVPEAAQDDSQGGDDDSFTFGSDDDAFLAAVDMGEGDLGRPINFEEGLGMGVSANASVGGGGDGSINESMSGSSSGRSHQPPSVSGRMGPPQNNASSSKPGQGQDVNAGRAATPALASGSSSSRQQFQQRPSNMNSNGKPGIESNNNSVHPPSGTGSALGNTTASKTGGFNGMNANSMSTPAPISRRGGFTFPSELSRQGQPQQSRQPPPQQPSSGIGMKRPAESIRSMPNANAAQGSRRPMQGMGLMSAGGGNTRQPFGIDSGLGQGQGSGIEYQSGVDGGDVKRVKR